MTREHFEELVERAYERLPEHFTSRIDNVRIVVEDYPSAELAGRGKFSRDGLLGLYQGVPLPQRNTWYGSSPTVPDTITLFQKNIERICDGDEEVERQVAITLFHEIGHYFGMNEAEVRAALRDFI